MDARGEREGEGEVQAVNSYKRREWREAEREMNEEH